MKSVNSIPNWLQGFRYFGSFIYCPSSFRIITDLFHFKIAKKEMGTPRQKHCALTIDDKICVFGGEKQTLWGTYQLGSVEIFEKFWIREQIMQIIRFTNFNL